MKRITTAGDRNSDGSSSRSTRSGDMDMTPMVDVTFLLLIFFMVTASFGLQKSIAMPSQKTEEPGQADIVQEPAAVEIQVDESGTFLVLTENWQEEAVGKQRLISTLRRAAQETLSPVQLKVSVDGAAKLDALVAALDAGTEVGFAEIELTQVDGFE